MSNTMKLVLQTLGKYFDSNLFMPLSQFIKQKENKERAAAFGGNVADSQRVGEFENRRAIFPSG